MKLRIAEAAEAAGREVLLLGSSLKRVVAVASELGMMDGLKPFIAEDEYGYIPRDKVVVILTGSQGEPRAALAKLARDEMRNVALTTGDTVVFSSKPIPGNEKQIHRSIDELFRRGAQVAGTLGMAAVLSHYANPSHLNTCTVFTAPSRGTPSVSRQVGGSFFTDEPGM